MATLARTACSRCREQKLRCSRELPRCDRCSRLDALCDFPPPPDRKLLAVFRAQPRKRKGEHRDSESPANRHQRKDARSASFHEIHDDTGTEDDTHANHDIQLSLPIQTLLQEVYMSSMFNAALIFNGPRAFQQRNMPRHVLLAVFASATIFLPPTSPTVRRNLSLLQPLGDLRVLGRQWAIRAGKEVLQDIDQPTFESVQTCEMLTLYWFSAGESQRNTMFSGIAYKAACTLELDLKEPTSSSSELTPASVENAEWSNTEMARRCFWAVWFTQCINSDHRLVGTSYDNRVMNLPLPLGESLGSDAAPPSSMTLSTIFNQISDPRAKSTASPSIMAELMVLVLNWAKIRDLIRVTSRVSVRDWLADLFELEGRLANWSARLPDSFVYSKRNLYEQLVIKRQPVYIFVHALYHQCRLVLHSSLVPHFSGVHLNERFHLHERLSPEATNLSARIALKSAQAISELGADLLALEWDTSQIAPFVGYCMYVSASIHVTLLSSTDPTLIALTRANLISNLKILSSMKLYWTNLERLWVRINLLYGAQLSRGAEPPRRGVTDSIGSQEHLSDLDRLASERRDTGKLSEPLADSVLNYTLRRLKPDAKVDSRAIQELEQSLHLDDLSHFMDVNSGIPSQIAPAPMMRPDGQSYSAPADQGNVGSAWAALSGNWDWMRSSQMPSLQGSGSGYDWWQLNLDSIQQPILPDDELFSLDF